MESDRSIKFFIYRDRRVLLVLHKVVKKSHILLSFFGWEFFVQYFYFSSKQEDKR